MTPKEKAIELVDKFKRAAYGSDHDQAHLSTVSYNDVKNIAMICVEEIIDHMDENWNNVNWVSEQSVTYNYWNKVKQEIEKL